MTPFGVPVDPLVNKILATESGDTASAANVEINHRFLKNTQTVAEQTARLSAIVADARAGEARIQTLVH